MIYSSLMKMSCSSSGTFPFLIQNKMWLDRLSLRFLLVINISAHKISSISTSFRYRCDIFFEIQLAIVTELYLSKTQMKVFKALLIRFARQRKIKVSLGIWKICTLLQTKRFSCSKYFCDWTPVVVLSHTATAAYISSPSHRPIFL